MGSTRIRGHIFVSGRVQGVYFRETAQGMAQSLKLMGWVRNLPDFRVEIVCEGKRENVERFLEWCRHGPPSASVTDVAIEYEEAKGHFNGFYVR